MPSDRDFDPQQAGREATSLATRRTGKKEDVGQREGMEGERTGGGKAAAKNRG